jgi:hypothetical protein
MPDPAAFLRKILPVLNQRLTESEFSRYTGELKINMYRHGLVISVADGEIAGVEPSESVGWGDLRIPPNLFAPLVLGQRSWEECGRLYPDLSGDPRALRIFCVLFPRIDAFLHGPY